jgi:hypothetical protein
MENGIPDQVWLVQILGNAVRFDKCTSLFPAMDERDSQRLPGYILYGILG